MTMSIGKVVLLGMLLAADVYIWTDREGVTHIEDQAPKIHPGDRIRVERHTFPTESDGAVAAVPEVQPLVPPPQAADAEAAALKDADRKEKDRLHREVLEKARRDYEVAKARHYWRRKLRDLEEKRLRVEELEKSEKTD